MSLLKKLFYTEVLCCNGVYSKIKQTEVLLKDVKGLKGQDDITCSEFLFTTVDGNILSEKKFRFHQLSGEWKLGSVSLSGELSL